MEKAPSIFSSAELFNPATDTFTKLTGHEQSLTVGRKRRVCRDAAERRRPDRRRGIQGRSRSGAELFNPTNDTFTKLPGPEDSLTGVREGAVGATLPSGSS